MQPIITVVGLGSGDAERLTLGNLRKLQEADKLYVRTKEHPVLNWLKGTGVAFESFDGIYESKNDFPSVYEEITERLIAAAASGSGRVVYAVPGHPMVAEATVKLLRERCPQEGIALEVEGGESFLDEAFARLGFDPIEGFQLLDAADLASAFVQPRLHTLIGQVYDGFTASDVKLSLVEIYPEDYEVVVGHALGVEGQEQIIRVPLYELDRVKGYGNLSLIYVPKDDDNALRTKTFDRLHEIVEILRSPGGCPWDREQTHASLRKNLIEETYEVIETIDEDDPDHMQEELGDLLLQVMLHSQMEQEEGTFDVYGVIGGLNEKLIFRHPHVFGDKAAEDAEAALANWDAMKAEEKRRKGKKPEEMSAIDGVPPGLPALMRAYKLQKKAAKVGFDWEDAGGALGKMEEELLELKKAIEEGLPASEAELELGDVLFSVVNAARFIGADPEEALSRTNRKFSARFRYMEQKLREQGKRPEECSLQEMDKLWEEAKREERQE